MNEKWLQNECFGATILKSLPGDLSTAPNVFAKVSAPADSPLLFYGYLECSDLRAEPCDGNVHGCPRNRLAEADRAAVGSPDASVVRKQVPVARERQFCADRF